LELIQTLVSVGDLEPINEQFSTVPPLKLDVSSTAQNPVVPVNVQSLIVTLLASIYTEAVPKLMPLSTASFCVTYTMFLEGV
jgi:hypothetical protein